MDAVILAGGRSRRMGVDKASLRLGDRSFLEILLAALAPLSNEVFVVGDPDLSADGDLDIRVVSDRYADAGPLGGLVTGLTVSGSEQILAVASDMPLLTTATAALVLRESDGYDVAVPEVAGRLHPLCAVYRQSCLPVAEEALARGQRKVISFYDAVRVKRVTEGQLRAIDPELRSLTNVNSWDNYQGLVAEYGADHLYCRA